MNVSVDTSAFSALLDADDDNHEAAAAAGERLLADRSTISTSTSVPVETAALLQNRLGVEALREFVADILPIVDVAWIGEGTHRSALHALLVPARHRLSLAGCTSFETMRGAGIEAAFCFDPQFAEQGFSAIPATWGYFISRPGRKVAMRGKRKSSAAVSTSPARKGTTPR